MKSLAWQCLPFSQVSPLLLYQALALRAAVFIVEQHCLYQDPDGDDRDALMVVASLSASLSRADAASEVIATARVLRPGVRFAEPSIGRVCTAAAHRRQGIGRALMEFAIRCTREHHPGLAIRIAAQAYLKTFYESLGFEAVSPPYLEDGILHLEMRLPL